MTTRPGDAPPLVLWLFELPGTRWGLEEARRARSAAPGLDVDVLTAVDEDETWIYVGGLRQGEEPGPADGPRPPTGELRLPTDGPRLLAALLGVDASALPEHRIRRLEGLLTLGDADDGARQPWHYVSQADIPAETEGEFNRWFDDEHLPRIAGVPGTVRARRFRTDGSPRYLAAYDLEAREVQGGATWRAAIASPWRDRIHPEFLRPRRLMLERLV